MRLKIRRMVAVLCLLVLCLSLMPAGAAALVKAEHPLLQPQAVPKQAVTKDRFTNILLLGVDSGFEGYWGSHNKKVLQECHTDALMVISINMTTAAVNLVSVPRDTVTFVPNVQGMYKLNAAFNCADTLEKGFENARNAVCWQLGGIKIDYYVCVDMEAMVKLCDFIGGVDLDIEMSYTGSSGIKYKSGLQHLDGQGMMDYARARKNASVNNNDIGRTGRQRQVVAAIAQKMISHASLIKPAWSYANGGEINFFTDMKLANVLNLANKIKNTDTIGSYVITGRYTPVCTWNFTITEPENRREVIRTVWGVDVEDIPYVSLASLKWLENYGFKYVHALNLAQSILKDGRSRNGLTAAQVTALDALEAELDTAIPLFDKAAETLKTKELEALAAEWTKIIDLGKKAYACYEPGKSTPTWNSSEQWWLKDEYINDWRGINWG